MFTDKKILERLLKLIILEEIVPDLSCGQALSARGLAVHWTFGRWYRRRASVGE